MQLAGARFVAGRWARQMGSINSPICLPAVLPAASRLRFTLTTPAGLPIIGMEADSVWWRVSRNRFLTVRCLPAFRTQESTGNRSYLGQGFGRVAPRVK